MMFNIHVLEECHLGLQEQKHHHTVGSQTLVVPVIHPPIWSPPLVFMDVQAKMVQDSVLVHNQIIHVVHFKVCHPMSETIIVC